MYDARRFGDRYDLYRPTVTTSDTRQQTVTVPDEATTEDLACSYFPTPGRFAQTERGIALDYAARMHIPYSQTLKPEQQGEQPDHVKVGTRMFVVLICWAAAGQTDYKVVLLEEA